MTSKERKLDLSRVFELEDHGPDTYVGESPAYPWGRIFGGLVVAQALLAATKTVDPRYAVHSLHAYFILGGDLREPVRYEVDRVRNGRSFCTRRVVARQSAGAILTLECSYQVDEKGPNTQSTTFPKGIPFPDGRESESDNGADRFEIKLPADPPRATCWARFPVSLGRDPALHTFGLAYLSDMNAMAAVHASYPGDTRKEGSMMGASLCHSIWFQRPVRSDEWLLIDMHGHGMIGSRGLVTGLVFQTDGTHVATIVQEGLLRAVKKNLARKKPTKQAKKKSARKKPAKP